MKKALIWFESHLGAGDAQLVAILCKRLKAQDIDVTLVTSSYDRWRTMFDFGEPSVIALPDLERRQDKHYYTPSGERFEGSAYERQRTEALLNAYDMVKPDMVITQSWPLMRNQFDHELVALTDHIAASRAPASLVNFPCDITFISDWLISKRPFNMADMLARYDRILVPGDGMLDFCKTHPVLEGVRTKLDYAGYFVEPTLPAASHSGEVVVCSGGGWHDSDLDFYLAAIGARAHSSLADQPWRIKVSRPACQDAQYQQIVDAARTADPSGLHIRVEPNDAHYKAQMAAANAVIIRGGYNTLMEAVQLNKAIVAIPRPPKGADQEQTARAEALANRGYAVHVTQAACAHMVNEQQFGELSQALDRSLTLQTTVRQPIDFNGASNAAKKLLQSPAMPSTAPIPSIREITHVAAPTPQSQRK